jgi:peptidoglycan/LPS O-acetylase OafA/YrhL
MRQDLIGKDLPALTGLRFFLALWVILHHLTGSGQMLEPAALALPSPLYTLIRGGYLAVTTFFVLSGFVLARTYSTKWTRPTLLRYALARFARVYPVYLLSLAIVAPFITLDATLLAIHTFLFQAWTRHLAVNWNTPAWSLSCEIFFYVTFPLAALLLRRAGWRQTLAIALAATILTRILWAAGVPDEIKPLIHFSDFLMGIAAARAYDLITAAPRRPAGAAIYLPAFAAAAAVTAWPQILPHSLDLNTALRPLNATLLIGLALGGGPLASALSTRAVVYLGKASYAMYILHVPFLWWYLRVKGSSGTLFVLAVIAVSAAVYRFVEEPANRYLRARFKSPAQPQLVRPTLHRLDAEVDVVLERNS